MFVAFSCKQRSACPSCHQKRALLTAQHVAEEVCSPVAHRQVVLTIPKRLRLHARFNRKLLGKLAACAWTWSGKKSATPARAVGRLAGDGRRGPDPRRTPALAPAHPRAGRLRRLYPGEFLKVPEFDMERLRAASRERCLPSIWPRRRSTPAVVEDVRGWPGTIAPAMVGGFGADQSVLLAAGDRAGIEHLRAYIARCPFSLSRLVRVGTRAGDLPRGEGRLPRLSTPGDGLPPGTKRNFQVL